MSPALAADPIELQFIPSQAEISGYRIYFAEPGDPFENYLEIGPIQPGPDGVATYQVTLEQITAVLGAAPTSPEIYIVMTAFNSFGESGFSNQIAKTLPAEEAPPDPVTHADWNQVFRNSFGLSQGLDGFDARVDFNGDGLVGIADFAMLRAFVQPDSPTLIDSGDETAEGSEYFMDFETDAVGGDPQDWFDTGADSSLTQSDALFKIFATTGNNKALGTDSTEPDIHSHFLGAAAGDLYSYEFTGSLWLGHEAGGIGVTVYSDYPNSDTYYRLRADGGSPFQLAPHPAGMTNCLGTTDTGVIPWEQTWYWFRLQAYDEAGGTRLRAKVWEDGTAEPDEWQASCLDTAADSYDGGVPGLWSTGAGAKYWDDLELIPLAVD